jgi:glucoamylase
MRTHRALLAAALASVVAVPATAQAARHQAGRDQASGAPGEKGIWTPADKHGFGTSHTPASKVWFTLRQSELTELYYPDLGTPAVRDLRFAVVSNRGQVQYDADAGRSKVTPLDDRSLSYKQTTTTRSWRLTKTVVTDPMRDAVLVKVRLDAPRHFKLYAVLDPALSNTPDDDRGATRDGGLVAWDDDAAVALQADGLGKTTSEYAPATDIVPIAGRGTDADAQPGNVVQAARIPRATAVALGFGSDPEAATKTARASLRAPFGATRLAYDLGWHAYLRGLPPAPSAVPPALRPEYQRSLLVLAASEDKTHRGAGVASPSMPWAWGLGTIDDPSDAYHLVWARDLYQVGTAQLAAGDRDAAQRAVDFLFKVQQKADGSFPQNSRVDGTPQWTNLQLDEVAFPIVLAWQLGDRDADTYAHVKAAADFIAANGPQTPQERWENQGGWSPATIAAEIAGLVTAADLARANGDDASATKWDATADDWQARVQDWTATSTGPYSDDPYYLRITKDGHPNAGTTYKIGDGGPSAVDQRAVVDPSFLELVRLGVKPWNDPVIRNTVAVVDQELAVDTPNGRFWHRFSFDGYGEQRDGGPWEISPDDTGRTLGRAWPIFAGERGEYELEAGRPAQAQLRAMAGAANDGGMIPEQVWDNRPPTGDPGFESGEGTFSATPLAWSHAQFVRLAWSMQAGRPVEQPSIVACRYVKSC